MTKEQILAELRKDPDFAKLPAEWQNQIAEKAAAGESLDSLSRFGQGSSATPLTIENIPQLAPQLMNEWNRVRAMGDRRSWEQWAADHSRVDPNWLQSVQYLAPQAQDGLAGTDEENAALDAWRKKASQVHTTISTNGASSTVPLEQDLLTQAANRAYADMEGDAARQQWARDLIASYDSTFANADQAAKNLFNGQQLQQETAASNVATGDMLNAVGTANAERNAALDQFLGTSNAALSSQVAARRQALADMNTAKQAALADQVAAGRSAIATDVGERGAALQTEVAARQAALAKAVSDLRAAQEPLNAERLSAAQTQATAVNLAAQQARDQAVAQAAQDGYVGSSSGGDAAMARALLAGRQGAAEQVGAARVANASDLAGIGRYGATEGRTLSDYGATQTRSLSDYGTGQRRSLADFAAGEGRTLADANATGNRDLTDFAANEGRTLSNLGATQRMGIANDTANAGMAIKTDQAQRNFSLFSNDVNRRLSNLNLPSQIVGQRLSLANAAEEFGNSGFNRGLALLNQFRTNGTPAPQTQANLTQANTTMGNGLQNVGGALAYTGFSAFGDYLKNKNKTPSASTPSGATFTPSPSLSMED